MKKLLALLLVAGMFVFASCGGNKEKEDENTDSTKIDSTEVVEDIDTTLVDTVVVDSAIVEEEEIVE
jgi:protein involved in sex pheromone biosynthesis